MGYGFDRILWGLRFIALDATSQEYLHGQTLDISCWSERYSSPSTESLSSLGTSGDAILFSRCLAGTWLNSRGSKGLNGFTCAACVQVVTPPVCRPGLADQAGALLRQWLTAAPHRGHAHAQVGDLRRGAARGQQHGRLCGRVAAGRARDGAALSLSEHRPLPHGDGGAPQRQRLRQRSGARSAPGGGRAWGAHVARVQGGSRDPRPQQQSALQPRICSHDSAELSTAGAGTACSLFMSILPSASLD